MTTTIQGGIDLSGSAKTTEDARAIGQRIQGFISKLAEHGMTINDKLPSGYSIRKTVNGNSLFIGDAETPEDIERLVNQWERAGWPSFSQQTLPAAATAASETSESLPSWAHNIEGNLVMEGRTRGLGDLTTAIEAVMPREGVVSLEGIIQRLFAAFPNATINYKSVSAALVPMCRKGGKVTRVGRGQYRWSGSKGGSVKTKPTANEIADISKNAISGWSRLLTEASKWHLVGISVDGEELFATPDGEVYAITVACRRV